MKRVSSHTLVTARVVPHFSIGSKGIETLSNHDEDELSSDSTCTQRRRHSSYQPTRENSYEIDAEAVFVKVHSPLFSSKLSLTS